MDIASLGIKIDTSDVAKAERELDGLAASGSKAEAAAKGTGEAWSKVGQKVGATVKPANAAASAFKQGSEAIKAQQAELGKLIGKIDPVVAALDRLDNQEKKLRGFKAGGLIDTESFNGYKAKIDAARASLGGVDGELRRTGISAKQSAQSLRQLPMQFSDIAISLQAGQNPMTVFLQQGAQIKDSFGGVGPALRETARYALGLVNPFTVAAAAAVVFALAYKQGSDEATAFNTALILTGNIAGTSVGQLQNAAAAMDKVSGTQRQAALALAEVAGTGKFTSDQIMGIASAAVAMEEVTGKAISETIADFKKLADEPAAAAAKLNEQYNFLTAAVYEQITALEQQGDAAGAAQLAIDSFGQVMESRAAEIESGLGLIERAWENIKDGAAEAWDEMLGVGRSQTPEQRLDGLAQGNGFDLGKVAASTAVLGPLGGAKEVYDQLTQANGDATERNRQIGEIWQEIQDRDEKAWVEGMTAQQEQQAVAAQQRIDQLRKSALSNTEKRAKALKDLQSDLARIRLVNPDDERLNAGNVARLQKDIAEQFKDPKVAKTAAVRDDAATKLLITLREQQAALSSQLLLDEKLTGAQKERAKFESLIADLKVKDILTADQKSLLANQESIKAQLDKNIALADEVQLHTDSIKLQERSAQLQESIKSSSENRGEQYGRNLDAFGQGRQAQEQAQAAAGIFREFRRYQDQLNKNTPKDLLGSEQYLRAREQIGQGLRDSLAEHEAYYQRLEELQGSWQVGASQAFADFADQSKDVAGQTSALIGNVLDELTQGIGDSFAEAALHGEDMYEAAQALGESILTTVISSLVQMGAQYAINSALEIAGITAVTGAKVAATTAVAAAEVTAIGVTTGAATVATGVVAAAQVPAAAATTAAWAPAATVASIGSFGAAAAIGLAAVVAAIALSKGFREGGYTGNGGRGDIAGVVHGQEYVLDADTTKRLGGPSGVEALTSGRRIAMSSASGQTSGSSSGGAPITNINNMTFPGITDAREAKRSTAQASRQVARAVQGTRRYS